MEEESEDRGRIAPEWIRLHPNLETEPEGLVGDRFYKDTQCIDMKEELGNKLFKSDRYTKIALECRLLREPETPVYDLSELEATEHEEFDARNFFGSLSSTIFDFALESFIPWETEKILKSYSFIRQARERDARKHEPIGPMKPGDVVSFTINGYWHCVIVKEVDPETETPTVTTPLQLDETTLNTINTNSREVSMAHELSQIPVYVYRPPSQNTLSVNVPHSIDSVDNLPSNNCEHFVRNCESQSQINKRTTYDNYNRPLGAKKPLDQLQSENTHEHNGTVQPLYHVSHHEPSISSNSDSHEILSRRTPNQITNRRRYDNNNRPIEPFYQSETQHKQNEKDKLQYQIMHCKTQQGCDQGQIPNQTSKTLLASLRLQSFASKFLLNSLSKKAPPCAVLPSQAVLLVMFVATAMLPYIALLVGNLTSVQRKYVGLWRPNELCDYC